MGNNRTKQAYVGLRAVVKRAVGLGGWHWLVSMGQRIFNMHACGGESCSGCVEASRNHHLGQLCAPPLGRSPA